MTQFDASAASRKGLEVRRARAALKAEIAQGKHSLVALFDQAGEDGADPVLSGLRVDWFLRAVPAVGVGKAHALLERLGINPRATLGGLRVRQRSALRGEVQQLFRRYFPSLRGSLVVLVGPSGVGKGTIVSWIVEHYPEFHLSVSATTRSPRPGERDGEHYYFVTDRQFDRLVADKGLLEWATVHQRFRYGTPREPVEALLDEGKNVILEIDMQGLRQVRRRFGHFISIFIAPPSFDELVQRLETRGTESERERTRRLRTARKELAAQGECDHVVVNDVVDVAAQTVVDLVLASSSRALSKE
jgi:guanylate kinase